MFKSIALLAAVTQASNDQSQNPVLTSTDHIDPTSGNSGNLIATDPTTTTGTTTTTTTTTTTNTDKLQMLGAWKDYQTCSEQDVTLFSSWKSMILTFVGVDSYPKFVPISYAKQVVQGNNYKITFDVSTSETNQSHLIVVVYQPQASDANQVPRVLSAVLPNGQRQISAGSHSAEEPVSNCASGAMGATSCWKTTIGADQMKTFVGFKSIIQSFHGSKQIGSEFTPIKYKVQLVNGMIYTIQYKTATGIVQATVFVPRIDQKVGETVKKVNQDPEVTQFVDEQGKVTGAYKLGTSLMMMASLVASVMLA